MPNFEDLPFDERPDLTPYIVHLTKRSDSDGFTAYRNLINILRTGRLWGSDSESGFIKGEHKAVCFMDVPFFSLKYVLNPRDCNKTNPRYEPFGIFVSKKFAYKKRCRPVLYLSNQEIGKFNIPAKELWRVVRLEVDDDHWISWLHEREWRCKGDFVLPSEPLGVLVRNTTYAKKLAKEIKTSPNDFKSVPKSILPLSIMCQGFLK